LRIGFLVERPTQFEAPFFRHVAAHGSDSLRVLFTSADPGGEVFDPELGHPVCWGFDLLGGYEHASFPRRGVARWLAHELRWGDLDLVIVNGYKQRPHALATALARRAGLPVALRLDSVRGSGPRAHLRQRLVSGVLSRAYDLFLGAGSRTLEYLRWCGVPAERTGLFPYAIDVAHFRTGSHIDPERRAAARMRWGVPAGARVVLALAKLHPREAPWDLLRAALHLRDPDLWLLVAGDGPSRPDLQRAARDLPRVRWLGYIPYPELPALYGVADLFVHPAREERWGVSVAEALACGLPVVASSHVGAAYDLVRPGENGFTYETGDGDGLARRIEAGLRLDPAIVSATNSEILARWDYAATWQGIVAACERTVERRSSLNGAKRLPA
jgi:glycosyltransferase involved in cell wall biosynthesis